MGPAESELDLWLAWQGIVPLFKGELGCVRVFCAEVEGLGSRWRAEERWRHTRKAGPQLAHRVDGHSLCCGLPWASLSLNPGFQRARGHPSAWSKLTRFLLNICTARATRPNRSVSVVPLIERTHWGHHRPASTRHCRSLNLAPLRLHTCTFLSPSCFVHFSQSPGIYWLNILCFS